MFQLSLLLPIAFIILAGCSDDEARYPSPEGMTPPYVLKEDCTFSIVEQLSKASITSPEVEGLDIAAASAGVSLGEKSITVANCKITENSHELPVYEN